MTQTLDMQEFGVVTGYDAPRRLPETTRVLAARYLSGEFGRAMMPAGFGIDSAFFLAIPSDAQIAAEAVRLMAAQAPVRVLPEERLLGAATLREATWHRIPLTEYYSISHTTLGFEKALRVGLRGLRAEVEARLATELDDDARDLLTAMRVCLDAMGTWHARYLAAAEAAGVAAETLAAAREVPERPPQTFHEALQALWFLWDFQRLCGNWSGLGRVDKMLEPFLDADLAAGRLTLDDARDLIAHFWIKGCEWISAEGRGSGDAQFYQNVVLAGIDEEGREVANAVTDLILDVVDELHISDFPIAVRISPRTPDALLRRIAQVQRRGGGIVAVYNEDRIIRTLIDFGYPEVEARNFANDGCWEVLIPGKTKFGYQPFDTLQLLQDALALPSDGPVPDYPDFEALYAAFTARMARKLTTLINGGGYSKHPNPLVALLIDDCIATGRGYDDGGPRYTVLSPHAGGIADTADSLLAIRTLVYEEGRLTLPELVGILRDNWAEHEDLRRAVRTRFQFWGNDAEASDAMVRRVFDTFTGLVAQVPMRYGTRRPAGISTFGREMSDFLPHRTATASGHVRGDILAPNFSPSPGSDAHGPTAVIRSHCAVDFGRLPCGTALDLKILPDTLRGDEGILALVGLMRTFVELGGVFMQLDVVDTALLRDAQAHPDKYPNLAVRVSGWSARFATLTKEWQELIIARSEQRV
jgi:formate C-acetyltransferase